MSQQEHWSPLSQTQQLASLSLSHTHTHPALRASEASCWLSSLWPLGSLESVVEVSLLSHPRGQVAPLMKTDKSA